MMTTRDAVEAVLFCKEGIQSLGAWMNTKPGPRRDRSCNRENNNFTALSCAAFTRWNPHGFSSYLFLGCSGCGVTR